MCKAITLFSLDGGKAELSHVFAHFSHVTALIVRVLKLQLQNMDAFMELSEPQQAAVCKEGAAVLSKWLGRHEGGSIDTEVFRSLGAVEVATVGLELAKDRNLCAQLASCKGRSSVHGRVALIVPVLKLQLQNIDAFMELSEHQQAAVCKESAAVLSKWLGRNCNNAQGLSHLSGQILSVATDSEKEEWSNSAVGRGIAASQAP